MHNKIAFGCFADFADISEDAAARATAWVVEITYFGKFNYQNTLIYVSLQNKVSKILKI